MASTSIQSDSTLLAGTAIDGTPGTPDQPLQAEIIRPDRQLPSSTNHRIEWMRDLALAYTELAGEALNYARLSAIRTWYSTRLGAVDNASRAAHKTQQVVTRTQNRARYVQREYPVRTLGVVAGVAFVAGVAARVWRSRAL